MGRKHLWKKSVRHMLMSRAVCVITAFTCLFLCMLTLLEFTVRKLEIEVPALAALTEGAENAWMNEYQAEEIRLEKSSDNEVLEEMEEAGQLEEPEVTGGIDAAEHQETEVPEEAVTETEEAEEVQFPYYIKVNRKQNCITIYSLDKNGDYSIPYKAMTCSTGLYNATPRGTFHLSTKYLWRELYGGVYGQYASRINGGILFHSVPYYKKNKATLCTDKYNKLGQQASMGCIRLTVEDAKWIAENCPSGTAVEIYDADDPGPLGKPETIKIDTDNPNKSWDPTDPDTENPWSNLSDTE